MSALLTIMAQPATASRATDTANQRDSVNAATSRPNAVPPVSSIGPLGMPRLNAAIASAPSIAPTPTEAINAP